MKQNPLQNVATALARHYGSFAASDSSAGLRPGEWSTLVRIVLEQGKSTKKNRDWSWITEKSLATAGEAAAETVSRLADVLESAGQAGNKAGLLNALAKWWQRRFPDADARAVLQGRSLEHWHNELRAMRGVSWDLADRILLVVGGLPVYPLDRASMRIAHRHGWMEATAEYDEWQAFFVSSTCESEVELEQLWRWNVRVGRDFCGKNPDCQRCPLKSLLPASGPVPLDGDE